MTFKFNIETDNFEKVWDYKNSWNIWSILFSFILILSTNLYLYTFFVNFIKKKLLNLATILFQKVTIIQYQKEPGLFSAYYSFSKKNTIL